MSDYEQLEVEKRWQDRWEELGLYHFDPGSDAPVYSIDNPPRYASGGLHVGHAAHYTHIDFVARYKRMCGHNVFFPLCFDVNGIPIEERVEKKHGITRMDIDRHDFIKLCEEFAEANIGEMTRQFKILGESMDPTVYYQTNAEYYRRLTQISFIKMFDKGLVYKGSYPINWCPRCMTALADAEVEYEGRTSKLNFVNFDLDGEPLQIATTRPELIATCQLMAVNPDDPRAEQLAGKKATTPIYGKEVSIIKDDKVAMDFGTGVVMICSIGDKDDLEWIQKYKLALDIAIDEQGRMNELGGPIAGMPIPEAKAKMIELLAEEGHLVKQEDTEQNVGTCWRCHAPVEFIVTPQWFVKTIDFKEMVLRASDEMDWFPKFMEIRLKEWVNSLEWDWVVSRQRYFATPIPLWECEECGEVVLPTEDACYIDPTKDAPPVESCPKCSGKLVGCEDVFDTWMDSSISPLYNTFWQRDEALFNRIYPMSLRPQAHDIIRTWAFYTILRCSLVTGDKPFTEIMMDGFILSEDGTPMHASKGNVIDPLEVLEKHGADPLRYYAANCALGEDNSFRRKDITRGERLIRKVLNLSRFIGGALDRTGIYELGDADRHMPDAANLSAVDAWILSRLNSTIEGCTDAMGEFRFDRTLRAVEQFLWHDVADNYIELVKHRTYPEDDSDDVSDMMVGHILYLVGSGSVKLMAPFLPHITEEVYHDHYKRIEGTESVHIAPWPKAVSVDLPDDLVNKGEMIMEIVRGIRRWKSDNGIALNKPISKVVLVGPAAAGLAGYEEEITRPGSIGSLDIVDDVDLVRKAVSAKPVHSEIGPKFKGNAKVVIAAINSTDPQGIEDGATVEVEGETIVLKEFVEIDHSLTRDGQPVEAVKVGEITVLIEA